MTAEKPHLQRLFEAVAAVMDLDRGRTRLELLFFDGRLERIWTHEENRAPPTLARFDSRAAHVTKAAEQLVEDLRARLPRDT